MTAFAEDAIRRLIPRWRFANQSYATEFASDPRVNRDIVFSAIHLENKLADWQLSKTIGTAIDVVSCGVGGGWFAEVLPAAKYLASHEDQLTSQAKALVKQVLIPSKQIDVVQPSFQIQNSSDSITFGIARDRVALTRRRLHNNPRNMLYWLDLSRAYAILGQTEKAIFAIERALYLSPQHRHALRAAARLFVFAGIPDRALSLLVKNPRTPTDPWLMAAEISIANIVDKHPRFARKGRLLIESGGLPPEHLTELQSALATLDLFGGAERRVRSLLRASLESPTENSVAQARWISTQLSGITINKSNLELPFNFETRCWRALEQGKWDQASNECMNWLLDEPFSSRPARVGSFIGISLTNDHIYAEMCVRAGLQADPDDPTLLNNLVVILAYQGKLLEAVEEFRRIALTFDSTFPSYIYLATTGLLQFRIGDIEEGRQFYDRAEFLAPSNSKTRVAVFRAREELYAKTSTSKEYFESVKKRNKETPFRDVERMIEVLETRSSSPTSADSTLLIDDNIMAARKQMSLILSDNKVRALIK